MIRNRRYGKSRYGHRIDMEATIESLLDRIEAMSFFVGKAREALKTGDGRILAIMDLKHALLWGSPQSRRLRTIHKLLLTMLQDPNLDPELKRKIDDVYSPSKANPLSRFRWSDPQLYFEVDDTD